jgi:protein-tyrosine-phosphatase
MNQTGEDRYLITFVCQANVCRSPLAVGILRKLIQEGDFQGGWKAASAGIWTPGGQKAHPLTLRILTEAGIEMADHRSREITRQLADESDLLLTMEVNQAEALRVEYPDLAAKVAPLSQLKGRAVDIADPIGGKEADFLETANMIESYLKGSQDQMKKWIITGTISE